MDIFEFVINILIELLVSCQISMLSLFLYLIIFNNK